MDAGAQKLLESATQRTLHAHAFSRSSSQASAVMTDLLSRYMVLLTSTCAKYAEHAGRTTLNVRDALGALDELGVSLEDLGDYAVTEGKELNRYALYTARRVEDLHEFKSQLAEGLKQDHDDMTLLHYAPCPDNFLEDIDEEDAEGEAYEYEETDIFQRSSPMPDVSPSRKRPPSRPTTPPLPLSPISNPSSPIRKRARISNWEPPEHIPDFLPPFPVLSGDVPGALDSVSLPRTSQPTMPPPPTHSPEARIEKPPVNLSQQPVTTSAASDILVQVPYSQSSLSTVPEWHLPTAPPPVVPAPGKPAALPTPQIEPSFIQAYHHILTHPPPPNPPPLNPVRHKIALALLKEAQSKPRWLPADTLYGSIGPCPPRVATVGPSYPIAIGDTPGADKGKEGKDKDTKLPPMPPRPIDSGTRLAPFVSQQSSHIPDLARRTLPPTILARTGLLSHPPILHRGTKALVYGPGIPAPWNANALPSDTVPPTPLTAKPKDSVTTNGKDAPPKPVLPDARLYATWDYEPKDFKVPLSQRGRSRMGSMQAGGSGIISLPISSRSKGLK